MWADNDAGLTTLTQLSMVDLTWVAILVEVALRVFSLATPDTVSCAAAISACEKGTRWQQAGWVTRRSMHLQGAVYSLPICSLLLVCCTILPHYMPVGLECVQSEQAQFLAIRVSPSRNHELLSRPCTSWASGRSCAKKAAAKLQCSAFTQPNPKGSSFMCRSCPFGRTTFFEFEDPECQAQGMFPYAKTHCH